MKPITMYEAIWRGAFFACSILTACQFYGYWCVMNQTYRSNRDVKKWLVKEGNILKYPFRKESRETSQTSNSNCVPQSGKVPEAS